MASGEAFRSRLNTLGTSFRSAMTRDCPNHLVLSGVTIALDAVHHAEIRLLQSSCYVSVATCLVLFHHIKVGIFLLID